MATKHFKELKIIFIMVGNLPKQIGYKKLDYLELLLENSTDGVTPSEVSEIFFDNVSKDTVGHALNRLKKNSCAVRRLENGGEYRYWITDRGVLRYDYLRSQEE